MRRPTIDIGVEVGTTIGGDNYGVSVEAKLSTEFGKRIDNSQTDAESKSAEVTKEINYFFPPHKDTLLTLDTRSVQTQRWLRINGVSNVGFDGELASVSDVGTLIEPSALCQSRRRW